jgi:uncharacterized protein YegP (UPF0339 family)
MLLAPPGVLGRYGAASHAINGIGSVKRNAPTAEMDDQTDK